MNDTIKFAEALFKAVVEGKTIMGWDDRSVFKYRHNSATNSIEAFSPSLGHWVQDVSSIEYLMGLQWKIVEETSSKFYHDKTKPARIMFKDSPTDLSPLQGKKFRVTFEEVL